PGPARPGRAVARPGDGWSPRHGSTETLDLTHASSSRPQQCEGPMRRSTVVAAGGTNNRASVPGGRGTQVLETPGRLFVDDSIRKVTDVYVASHFRGTRAVNAPGETTVSWRPVSTDIDRHRPF